MKNFESPLPHLLAQSFIASVASQLYGGIVGIRNKAIDLHPEKTIKLQHPVISIGGIRAGGSGKTPATMMLIEHFLEKRFDIAVLSRGYRRRSRLPLQVSPGDNVDWKLVGDEPAMMRASYPGIWLGIGSDRLSNAIKLKERMKKRSLFLMDDGFQHRTLKRDVDIVCIHEPIFNDRLLPQGYLREPIGSLSRANVLFLITTEKRVPQMREVGKRLAFQVPGINQYILVNKIEGWVNAHSGEIMEKLPFDNPVAVCGIARPSRFFDILDEQRITCSVKKVFPDHYRYQEYDIIHLRKLYSQGMITTEKDIQRLRSLNVFENLNLWYLKIRLQFAEKESSDRFNHYIKGITF